MSDGGFIYEKVTITSNSSAYGALCCAFNTYSNFEIPGIDESGNIMKGYIRTDVLRVVSPRLCTNAGSIFQ